MPANDLYCLLNENHNLTFSTILQCIPEEEKEMIIKHNQKDDSIRNRFQRVFSEERDIFSGMISIIGEIYICLSSSFHSLFYSSFIYLSLQLVSITKRYSLYDTLQVTPSNFVQVESSELPILSAFVSSFN